MRRLILAKLVPCIVFAHHGVAGLTPTSSEGPGAGVETSTAFTLPEGRFLIFLKNDYARFRKYSGFEDQKESYNFTHLGIAYGIKPWLTFMITQPYAVKKAEYGTSRGLMDSSLHLIFGFKYDEGFKLVPRDENLEDQRDWHFALNLGLSLPTGGTNREHSGELFPPDMQPGFGKPSYQVGLSATKWLTENYTTSLEASYQIFNKKTYKDSTEYRFGNELRLNMAHVYKLYARDGVRLDGFLEFNFLHIDRDREKGEKLRASGGNILYLQPGLRFYYGRVSLAGGVKLPAWKDLNEQGEQQGSEGKEKYRIILGASYLF